MRYEDIIELEALVDQADEKWQALNMHQMLNTPVDPNERKKALLALEIAEVEWRTAFLKLEALKRNIADRESNISRKNP